jgi:glycosyltransferase involved in cell wall biosynthesis
MVEKVDLTVSESQSREKVAIDSEDLVEGRRYRYAMISSEIRRDLQAPLAYFRKLDIYHFYRSAPWNDMRAADFDERTIRFCLPFDLFWKLQRTQPEIVQGPEPFSLLMLPFLFATLVYLWVHPHVRLVTLSLEPIPVADKYTPLILPFYHLILRWWFRRASVIFWFDSGSRDNLLANGADSKKMVELIYGSWGVDLDEFSPEGEKIEIGKGKPVILYVGRLSPVKGVNYLLDAFYRLKAQGIQAHLVIVGDGSERERLRIQAESLGLVQQITWFGTIKNADLPPYMRAAQILVLPSISTKRWVQQLSITAWQAMACGLPVIATRTGCMAEFTPPDTGFLVPERDPESLAQAMSILLEDPRVRKEMSVEARRYAYRRFDAIHNVRLAEESILEWCA